MLKYLVLFFAGLLGMFYFDGLANEIGTLASILIVIVSLILLGINLLRGENKNV